MATDIPVENDFKKNERNPVCETMVWPLADRVKNLIEKKWPGLSDSHMTSGGLTSHWSHHKSKFQDREIVAPRLKVPNIAFGRTTVKGSNWLHHGWKCQIGLFGCSATKMGRKSGRDTLSSTGAKFREETLA